MTTTWDELQRVNYLDSLKETAKKMNIELRFLIALLLLEGYLEFDAFFLLSINFNKNDCFFDYLYTKEKEKGMPRCEIQATSRGEYLIRSLLNNEIPDRTEDWEWELISKQNDISDFVKISGRLGIKWQTIIQTLKSKGYIETDNSFKIKVVDERNNGYFVYNFNYIAVTWRGYELIERLTYISEDEE